MSVEPKKCNRSTLTRLFPPLNQLQDSKTESKRHSKHHPSSGKSCRNVRYGVSRKALSMLVGSALLRLWVG